MSDPFWDPIFERLQQNSELIRLMISDLDSQILIKAVAPNPALQRAAAPYIKKKRLTSREAFEGTLARFAEKDPALRRVLFFEWIVANPTSMAFPCQALDASTNERLMNKEFGDHRKLIILSFIEPRPDGQKLLKEAAESMELSAVAVQETPADPEDSITLLKREMKTLGRSLEDERESRQKLEVLLSERGETLAKLNLEIVEKARTITELQRSLENLHQKLRQSSIEIKPAAHKPDSGLTELESELSLARDEIKALKQRLQRSETTVKSGFSQLQDARDQLTNIEDRQQTVENLRKLLDDKEVECDRLSRGTSGRLLSGVEQFGGKSRKVWFFQSFSGETRRVPAAMVKSESLVEAEWVNLFTDRNNSVTEIKSLESERKLQTTGLLRTDGKELILDSHRGRFAVQCLPPDSPEGLVVSATILPEAIDRPEGVYAIEVVLDKSEGRSDQGSRFEASFKKIREFLRLARLDHDTFVEFLLSKRVVFERDGEHLVFNRPLREVLLPLRSGLGIKAACSRSTCLEKAQSAAFLRSTNPGDTCDYCLEEHQSDTSDTPEKHYDFGGASILIAGGDRVGSRYREFLAGHNLKAEWISGHQHLAGLRSGMGEFRAVFVILKQISHTLLREINLVCHRDGIPVVYCTRRGVSGVLAEALQFFQIKTENS